MLVENDINELNLTDPDAKTVKFGAHQGTDVGYNVQAVVDSKNKLITTFKVINDSQDQGQLYDMSILAKKVYNVESIEVLADKGYFSEFDLRDCEHHNIVCYVSKPSYNNSTGNSIYFNNKFNYNANDNTYLCPEDQILYCITKKPSVKEKRYANYAACSKCINKEKCTTSKLGRVISRKDSEVYSDIVVKRTKDSNQNLSLCSRFW